MKLGWRYGSLGMLLRTLHTRVFRSPDRARWEDLENYDPDWDRRTKALAALIPEGSDVLEFGAGRRQLERWLPHGCRYTPSDLVSRGPDTWICDLNQRPLPTLPASGRPRVIVFSGVLEYLVDLPGILCWLAPQTNQIVASYNCAETSSSTAEKQLITAKRFSAGWVNAFTLDELEQCFLAAGFERKGRSVVSGEPAEYLFSFFHHSG